MAGLEKQCINSDMVRLNEDEQTICTVFDKTPNSTQKKISIIVRPSYTVAKVISDIKIQFSYENFDLALKPSDNEDLIYLNDKTDTIFYKIPGFVPKIKNNLILSPPDTMLSTSEFSSFTIQSKIKTSSLLSKSTVKEEQSLLKGQSSKIFKGIRDETIKSKTEDNSAKEVSSAISNGVAAVHCKEEFNDTVVSKEDSIKSVIKKSNNRCHNENSETNTSIDSCLNVENSIKSKSLCSKAIKTNNISETLEKITDAITEQINVPVTVTEANEPVKSNCNVNEISCKTYCTQTLISTVEIQTSNEVSESNSIETTLPKKSPSPKKVIKKKVVSSALERKDDVNNICLEENKTSTNEADSSLKKSPSPKKVIIKKRVASVAISDTNSENVNISSKPSEIDAKERSPKALSPVKKVKKVVKKSVKTAPSENSAPTETTTEGLKIENETTGKLQNECELRTVSTSSSIIKPSSITTIEIDTPSIKNTSKSETSTSKDNSDRVDTKKVSTKTEKVISTLEILPKIETPVNETKEIPGGHATVITLKSKKVSGMKTSDNKGVTENKIILSNEQPEEDKITLKLKKSVPLSAVKNSKVQDSLKQFSGEEKLGDTKVRDVGKAKDGIKTITVKKTETAEILLKESEAEGTCELLNKSENLKSESETLIEESSSKNTPSYQIKLIEIQQPELSTLTEYQPVDIPMVELKTKSTKEVSDLNDTKKSDEKVSKYLDDHYGVEISTKVIPPTEAEFTETSINVPPPPPPAPPALPMFKPTDCAAGSSSGISGKLDKSAHFSTNRVANCGYVGLVNQAMTCYLNSLLQALFMTPEFRNALYKREFDNCKDDIIPYQLQRLFVNLQTSTKNAVETTDLTKSFGWDSTEAWQQHDIQELCRVMFDALEHKFKNTDQANLINILYEGKMIDYVKCLECKTEKSREDTFLDIPLPVRPFGSTVAYGSIEEALRAFVQPETLDGNNQYFCEKCNKKCDAHKGLKFKKFPYILTLHLKRFDFDYQTLHRIKLNDKVTFPQTLNLNSFVNSLDSLNDINSQNSCVNQANGYSNIVDDCSTTDSGAALEEDNSSGIGTTASSSHHENDLQDDDEGIDTGNGVDSRSTFNPASSGPYMYELFAIMIHSGSASGGHYYAYIKEFENGEWYCFNDQTVSSITQEDIQKSFGGSTMKAYYSSMYSSSTNAYMLMYRQIDSKRNEKAIKKDEFPEHIRKLIEKMKTDEETKRTSRTFETDIIRQKVYFYNPIMKQMKDSKIYVARDFDLESALDSAYSALKVSSIAPIDRCRLVAYDHNLEEIECSFEGREKEEFGDILKSLPADIDFLLEFREPNEEFEKYKSGGVTVKVFIVDLLTADLDGPHSIRVYENEKQGGLKKRIAKKLKLDAELFVSIKNYYTGEKVYVAKNDKSSNINSEVDFKKFIENHFSSVNCYHISVPLIENENLEVLGIPYTIEQMKMSITPRQQSPVFGSKLNDCGNDVVDAVMLNSGASSCGIMSNSYNDMHNSVNSSSGGFDYNYSGNNISGGHTSGRSSPPQISISQGSNSADCNSEDNSLSDGDRTLVESNQHGSSQVSSTSHSPQLSSPEDEKSNQIESIQWSYSRCLNDQKLEVMSDDEEFLTLDTNLYFRAYRIPSDSNINGDNTHQNLEELDIKTPFTLKIYADKYMKIGSLKRALEPYINVSAEFFKITKKPNDQLTKNEYPKNSEDLTVFKDGEQLMIELGREAKKGERKAKVYFIRRKDLNDETGKLPIICEFIFKLGISVLEVKKQIVDQLHRIDSKQYGSLTVENCRLWEKSGRNPIKILSDDYKLSLMKISINCEFVVQECEEGVKTCTSDQSLTLFVRRWYPSKYQLGEYQEITLEKDGEIRRELSLLSGIPEGDISFAKVNSSCFPCNNISLMTLQTSLSWFNEPMKIDSYPLLTTTCGCVYIYKDNTEILKELTPEERKELTTREKSRLDRLGGGTIRSLYSPRRERALKIYLDTSPKSSRDD